MGWVLDMRPNDESVIMSLDVFSIDNYDMIQLQGCHKKKLVQLRKKNTYKLKV